MNEACVRKYADKLRVMGHPLRLKILMHLKKCGCSVGEISGNLGIPQATTSQHLSLLRSRGILVGEKDGLTVNYSIADEKIDLMLETLLNVLQCDAPERSSQNF